MDQMRADLDAALQPILAEAKREEERVSLHGALTKLQEVDPEHLEFWYAIAVVAADKNAHDVWVVPSENPAEINVCFTADQLSYGTFELSTGTILAPTRKMKLNRRQPHLEQLATAHPNLLVDIGDGKWAVST